MHQFRIRGKELRYALESLRGAFPSAVQTRLYETVEAIQDRLGEVNDLATAKARLKEKVEGAHDARAAAPWHACWPRSRTSLTGPAERSANGATRECYRNSVRGSTPC